MGSLLFPSKTSLRLFAAPAKQKIVSEIVSKKRTSSDGDDGPDALQAVQLSERPRLLQLLIRLHLESQMCI